MGVGEIAGLIAAIAFAILVGFLAYPLIRLGKLLDEVGETVKKSTDHAIPALDEGVTTVKQVNQSLKDVNRISAAASSSADNIGALTDLYGSFLGKPVIKLISTWYALKSTVASFVNRKSDKQPAKTTTTTPTPTPSSTVTPLYSHTDLESDETVVRTASKGVN